MRALRIIALHLVVSAVFAAVCGADDEIGAISGTVRDGEGRTVDGATVTLKRDSPPPNATVPVIEVHTVSGRDGQYRFTAIPAGKYRVSASMSGFVASPSEAVQLSAAQSTIVVDFKLMPQASGIERETEAKSPTTPQSHPPKFEAAGVRGLIDPGGYSAPAQAAAASGVIQGIADMKRVGNENAGLAVKSWPCGIEPELSKAVAANPGQGAANRRLGEFYVAHNQFDRAIPFLQKAREIDVTDEVAARDLAVAWMKTGQFDSARELLVPRVEKHSTPENHRLLARAQEGSGMFRQASQEYRLAAKEDPSEENLFGEGYELILAGSPAEAARAFEFGLKLHPESVQLLIGAGAAQLLQGHTSEGLLLFLRASDLDPSDPRSYAFLTSASGISRAESERVRDAFKRFVEIAPSNGKAWYFYALSLMNGNAADSARTEALFKRAIALDPNLAEAHFQLGIVQGRRGDYESAAREYEAAIRLAPALKEAHYRLAGAYQRIGQPNLAAREMQLFQQARERESSTTDSNIGIEQFVSVINPPELNGDDSAQCPQVKR